MAFRQILCGALTACLLSVSLPATFAAPSTVESAASFRGQTFPFPSLLGNLQLTTDCDPAKAAKNNKDPDHFCHLMDGLIYKDGGASLTLYDTSLLPAKTTDASVMDFMNGMQILRQVLGGTIALEAYGTHSVDAEGTIRMNFLPLHTRASYTVAVTDVRMLKMNGANVGVSYIAADMDTATQSHKLYTDYVFMIPGSSIMGVYSMVIADANKNDSSSFEAYADKAVTGSSEEEKIVQLENALFEYTAKIAVGNPTYESLYGAITEMLANTRATPFVDVLSTTPYAESILAMRAQGVIQGYADGTYKPANPVNRAEFMKILVEASGAKDLDGYAKACFPDVDASQWYAKYVCYGKDKNIIGGYADGSFRPQASINLAEALKIVFTTYQINPGPTAGEWYEPFVNEAKRRGMLVLIKSGVGDNISRGEMAELLYRLENSL